MGLFSKHFIPDGVFASAGRSGQEENLPNPVVSEPLTRGHAAGRSSEEDCLLTWSCEAGALNPVLSQVAVQRRAPA